MKSSNKPKNIDTISNKPKRLANLLISLKKNWYKFSKGSLSIVGLIVVTVIVTSAIFAPQIAPYPEHKGAIVEFENMHQPPSLQHFCGTDQVGRDIFSRILFGYRGAIIMVIVVLLIAVPIGMIIGLVAGFFNGTIIDTILMRITDIFCSLPPFVMALAIASVLTPTMVHSMIAISLSWWATYARLVYGMASSIRNEYFVIAADLTGASKLFILFKEILPNCLSPVFTRMALDVGWLIIVGASLSFVGLGEQPPTPALGQMVSDGASYLPTNWWVSIFPAIAIVIIILGFNLVGDGIRDMLEAGRE